MKIPPFLQHLRTDSKGRPVPYINLWGGEDVDRISIQFDRHVGQAAVFLDDIRETEPDFLRQNMQRQRECMVDGLCQVCARPVPWSRRWLVVSTVSRELIRLGNRDVTVLFEPWLDERCATFAVERCPGLIRRQRTDDLRLVPVRSRRDVRLITSVGTVDGPLHAASIRLRPALWVKVLLTSEAAA